MNSLQKTRIKLIIFAIFLIAFWIFSIFYLTGCAAAPTHCENCTANDFLGRDYYDVDEQFGKLLWVDFKGDDMIRQYKLGECITTIVVDRENLIQKWSIKGKCGGTDEE